MIVRIWVCFYWFSLGSLLFLFQGLPKRLNDVWVFVDPFGWFICFSNSLKKWIKRAVSRFSFQGAGQHRGGSAFIR